MFAYSVVYFAGEEWGFERIAESHGITVVEVVATFYFV